MRPLKLLLPDWNAPCKHLTGLYKSTKYYVRCDKILRRTPNGSQNSPTGTVPTVLWWLLTSLDQNSDFPPPSLPKFSLGWTNDSYPSPFTLVKPMGSMPLLEHSPLAVHYVLDTA